MRWPSRPDQEDGAHFAEHSNALPNSPYVVSSQSGDDPLSDRSASELLRDRRPDHLQPLDKTTNGPPGANRNAARDKLAFDTSPSKRFICPSIFLSRSDSFQTLWFPYGSGSQQQYFERKLSQPLSPQRFEGLAPKPSGNREPRHSSAPQRSLHVVVPTSLASNL
jgi:hypothetical protein